MREDNYGDVDWIVSVSGESLSDAAMDICLQDLVEVGRQKGVSIEPAGGDARCGNLLVVGDPSRNRLTGELVARQLIQPRGAGPQGYEILNAVHNGSRAVVISGGSLIGDVYGLYEIRDHLRISNRIDPPDLRGEPDLGIRYTRISVGSREDIRRALRYRLNLVYGENPLNLVPWGDAALRQRNKERMEETRELADYAHSLHMRFLARGTEFTYHPELLEEFDATLDPSDPRLWEAFRAKFRRLFEAVPELDGVCTFTGDEQRYWDPYRTFDLMHGGEGCDWSLERRFRTYLRSLWEVVVGEFDRMLVVRTWNTNSYEQHSQPDIYSGILNEDVPIRNLYLVPSFTQNDRWWFQAYNPTFNLTPHSMMTVFETMDYHDGAEFFPSFPGSYFGAGLDHVLGANGSNLEGASLDLPREEGWDTMTMTAYTVRRLTWDHLESPERIAEDFCALNFGPEAAKGMAEIVLLSPVAYKYGLYIEPVTRGAFSSLPHIRTHGFVAEGYPAIDGGRAHLDFLRGIYLRCKPWMRETLMYLDHGLEAARLMERKFDGIRDLIREVELQERVSNSLRSTRLLIEVNNLYFRTFAAYFEFMDDPAGKRGKRLAELHQELGRKLRSFRDSLRSEFRTYGVDQLVMNVAEALDDRDGAMARMTAAPTPRQIESDVVEQQRLYREIIDTRGDDLVKIMYWEGRVDGRDILSVRGETASIRHLRWDRISLERREFFRPLPARRGSVLIEDIESQEMHPFVIQHPGPKNDFTARIYLNDVPGGAHWFRFNLYFTERSPGDLGLDPWRR